MDGKKLKIFFFYYYYFKKTSSGNPGSSRSTKVLLQDNQTCSNVQNLDNQPTTYTSITNPCTQFISIVIYTGLLRPLTRWRRPCPTHRSQCMRVTSARPLSHSSKSTSLHRTMRTSGMSTLTMFYVFCTIYFQTINFYVNVQ